MGVRTLFVSLFPPLKQMWARDDNGLSPSCTQVLNNYFTMAPSAEEGGRPLYFKNKHYHLKMA